MTRSTLTDVDKAMLDFEAQHWRYAGAKEAAIAERFGVTATRHYQRVAVLLEHRGRRRLRAGDRQAPARRSWRTSLTGGPPRGRRGAGSAPTGMRWQAVWHEPDGTRRRRSFATKGAAQAHLEHVGVSQRSGTYVPPDRGRITVAAMANRWLAEQVHQRATSLDVARRRLTNTVLPILGGYAVADVDRGVVQRAVTAWARDLAPTTVRVAYVCLAGVFSLAVEERRIVATPCRRINLPPVEREPVIPLTVAEVQELVDRLWTPYRRMAVLAAATGMRSGELRGLTWDRIAIADDGASAQVRVARQLVGGSAAAPVWGPLKTTSSRRVISLGKATVDDLGEPGEGLVVRGARGGAVNRERASERGGTPPAGWVSACGRAGMSCGTSTRPYSSPRACPRWRSRTGSGTRTRRRRCVRTGTCGRTTTSACATPPTAS